jgi:hypothetical protein
LESETSYPVIQLPRGRVQSSYKMFEKRPGAPSSRRRTVLLSGKAPFESPRGDAYWIWDRVDLRPLLVIPHPAENHGKLTLPWDEGLSRQTLVQTSSYRSHLKTYVLSSPVGDASEKTLNVLSPKVNSVSSAANLISRVSPQES